MVKEIGGKSGCGMAQKEISKDLGEGQDVKLITTPVFLNSFY